VVRIVFQRSRRQERPAADNNSPTNLTLPLPDPGEGDSDRSDGAFGEKEDRPRERPPRDRRPRRRSRFRLFPRIPRWLTWGVIIVVLGVIFRRAVAWLAVTVLAAALHVVGANVHLPSVKFGWPWQQITSGTTTNTIIGPWVLQKIEGISKPALGTENFNFLFTRKVSKSIGPWPCWYSSTFYTVGHASATVDLNPGPSWWKSSTGHYQLRVVKAPVNGKGGQVSIIMSLPDPQLPQSVHDVTVDNTLSKPVSTDHSWTYPGLGCGALLKPQFAESVVYAQAQQEAFDRVKTDSSVNKPLISAAENEATTMIRNNFIQPTLNALGYTLTGFQIKWVASPGS
jgi:hypothetical protein